MTLSILIPAYNEQKTIYELLGKVVGFVRSENPVTAEIVVVNDASVDNTVSEVERFKNDNKDIDLLLVSQEYNQGKGVAIRKALEVAKGDIFVVQDADLEYDPQDFSEMLPYILSGEYQVVFGSRFLNHKNKHSYHSFYLGGRLVSITANVLYGLHLTDEPTCYKMFTREVNEKIHLRCEGFEFCPELTAKVARLGYEIQEVPIHYYPRSIAEGKKIKWTDGVEAIWTLLKYRFTKKSKL